MANLLNKEAVVGAFPRSSLLELSASRPLTTHCLFCAGQVLQGQSLGVRSLANARTTSRMEDGFVWGQPHGKLEG